MMSSRPNTPLRRAFRTRGFTLTELMVAVVISLLLLIALGSILLNVSRANSEMSKTNSQIENGRFALQLLQTDLSHGGFWGGHVPQFDDLAFRGAPLDAPSAVPDPCRPYEEWDAEHINNLLVIPVQAYEAPPASCGITDQQPNTDVLVVRHAETCVPGSPNCDPMAAGRLYFQTSFCAAELNADPIYHFRLATDDLTLKRRGCTGTPPATVGDIAPIRRFISHIYYVRNHARAAGDGIPTLVRAEFDMGADGTLAHQPAVPLIEGIESMRAELGIDDEVGRCMPATSVSLTDEIALVDPVTCTAHTNESRNTLPINRGDGIPDRYARCAAAGTCDENALANVVAVKLFLLARAVEPSPGHVDNRTYVLSSDGDLSVTPGGNIKRQVFTSTVRLANVSGRRETP